MNARVVADVVAGLGEGPVWEPATRSLLWVDIPGGKLPRTFGFDRGPVTGIGGRATIHQGQIYRSAGRMTTFFPSFRIISDLSETTSLTNLYGGPSDRRFSQWYVSDLDNWVNGTYKRLGPEIEGTTHPL